MRLYMGWDSREVEAYKAAERSLSLFSLLKPEPLQIDRLGRSGLLRRPVDHRGQMYDLPSNAPCSTEFASSRFLVPIICQSGWALFVDCDVVFLADPLDLMHYADQSKAVMVVKHKHQGTGLKMGGMVQTSYHRKNWSSVMLFNCDHPANQRLTLDMVNNWPGRDLHGFQWLADHEIGALPHEWNWLVNVQPKPANPKIAHFTLGGPWIEGWTPSQHDDFWLRARHG